MNSRHRFLLELLLLCSFLALSTGSHAEEKQRFSISLRYSTPSAKAYNTMVPRTGEQTTLPISISDTRLWVVRVDVESDHRSFFVSVEDPALLAPAGRDIRVQPLTIFEGEFDLTSGKAVTVLKSDQYTLDITLTLE
ncbi:hypothetical protein [Prosthecobacter sp.]|uniref:hypothetical protein n=1 Tax=Prosthecobacter sp. TaxID=1965333 RepID=UPI001DE25B72|nr:hypothetical protein [Prosthecobacter sp.]MCB1278349.1 hypothetical protein [Prosthecobacter sp.]